MALFIAYNAALSSAQIIAPGTSYATAATAKVALQLSIPSAGVIKLIEWGCSFDGTTAATPALLEVATTDTATTGLTTHTTTTIKPFDQSTGVGPASRLTMGTGETGYGAATIVSNTTLRPLDRQYIAPTNQYIKMWPLGREPMIGNAAAENYLQFRIMTSATVNASIYAVWEEHI